MPLFSKVGHLDSVFSLISDVLLEICGRLRGQSIVEESLRSTDCGFCKLPPVSESVVLSASTLRGTLSRSYERLLAPTVSRAPNKRRRLEPIIAEGFPMISWKCSAGSLAMRSYDDIGLCICAGRLDSLRLVRCDVIAYVHCLLTPTQPMVSLPPIKPRAPLPPTQLLVPLPPTSEQPGNHVYRTHIHDLDLDSLLQIFRHYRLGRRENWNGQLQWRKLAQICRRWRNLVYDFSSHLDISLLLTNDSPSLDTLAHLPPLPLVINYSNQTRTMARKDEDNIHFGLQQHDRVRKVAVWAPSSRLHILLEPMNKLFPKLEALTLSSTTSEEMNLMLPETFQAPDLHHLALHGIGLPTRLPLLSSAIALSTLSLTNIGASSYFPPGHLVAQLQGLHHLEELSIGFAIPISLPSSARELLLAPISPVTVPSMRRLTFRGVDVYLDNLIAQINTPLLERLSLTLFFGITFTLVNLAEFIHRTEGFECLVAKIVFGKYSASIDAGHNLYEQQGIGNLSLKINCKRFDWQVDSAAQVCSALGNVMSLEELTLDLDVDGMPSDWENTPDSMTWHELLLPFIRAKKLHVDFSLTLELCQALQTDAGSLVPELLPELQELEVELDTASDHAKRAVFAFIESRKSMGRPVHLMVTAVPIALLKDMDYEFVDKRYQSQARKLTSLGREIILALAKERTSCSYDELRR